MTSPSLDRPLLPLALALPRMLQEIEAALATAGPDEARRLAHRRRQREPPSQRIASPSRESSTPSRL